jgi:HNH endonuclease
MRKGQCPECGDAKDVRAVRCHACRIRLAPARLGTGKGWYLHCSGYIVRSDTGQGLLYQHRDVMAKMLKRTLRTNEHVHHINGDRTDNRPANLELIDASAHAKLHATRERMTAMSKLGLAARWGNRNSNLYLSL